MGARYSYRITTEGKEMLADYEAASPGKAARDRVAAFTDRFKTLMQEQLWTLELASTVAYYRCVKKLAPKEARAKTAEFKHVRTNAAVLSSAEQIAERFAPPEG